MKAIEFVHESYLRTTPMHPGIRAGWPKVLSSLKSLLETGKPLPRLWVDGWF